MDYSKFLSRKFIVAIVTILAVVLGLTEEVTTQVVALAMAYFGAQGYVDSKKE